MGAAASPKRKQPVAKYMVVGIVILAIAAVIMAWIDESGVGQPFIQALNNVRLGR